MAKRKGQPRQRSLPGTQSQKNVRIERCAHDYMEARDARMAETEVEVERKGKLLSAMNEAKLKSYRRNGLTIEIVVTKEKIKVRNKAQETPDADDKGDDIEVEDSAEA